MYYYDKKHRKQSQRHFTKEDFIFVFMLVLALISATIPFLFA